MEPSINKNQIQIIHVLKAKLNMSDEDYRSMLFDNYQKKSSTRLSFDQANNLIRGMKRQAGDPVEQPYRFKPKNVNLPTNRPGMASGKQIGMLLGIWSEVSVLPEKDQRDALDKFLINRFGIGGLRMLSQKMVGPVRHALIAMQKQPRRDVRPDVSLSSQQQHSHSNQRISQCQ